MAAREEWRALSCRLWQQRKQALGDRVKDCNAFLEGLQGEERQYLQYILGTLPPSDLTEYGPAFFLRILRQAFSAREQFCWCAGLSEEMFLLHVAYPRIHDEALSDCRTLFRQALEKRVEGLSLKDAILEVNRWCAEQVTYRSTDTRTASALEVYRRGLGRCGEESVFAVTALRSVGIAARQVYCPWWSHCDDNHAWVECWDGEAWRFLGACEPEPELDRGWFPAAASRAMLIHSRVFLPEVTECLFPGVQEEDLYAVHGMVYEVVTERYADTLPLTVWVRQPDGTLAAGAAVTFSVLNMGAFLSIAEKRTDGSGTVRLRLGKGSVKILCRAEDGARGEVLLDTARETSVTVTLEKETKELQRELEFTAPAGGRVPKPLSSQRKQLRKSWLDTAAALREGRPKVSLPIPEGRQGEILATLSEKDRACGVEPAVLQDGEAAFCFEKDLPEAVFREAVLPPRIGNEPLTPWRRALRNALEGELQGQFASRRSAVWEWIGRTFLLLDTHPTLVASPMATLGLKAGNQASLRVLFCAVCRCLGIPARLSPLDGSAQYWQDGSYRSAEYGEPFAGLTLDGMGGQVTVSRIGEEQPLFTGSMAQLQLPGGTYRLIAAVRLPSGGQVAREEILQLKAGETRRVWIPPRKVDISALLTRHNLPDFPLWKETGEPTDSRQLLRGKTLLCWLEPGREPTEHLLRELAEVDGGIDCPVHFVTPTPDCKDPALLAALAALPEAEVWQGDFQDTGETLARCVFAEPGVLPLTLLCDGGETCLFSCAGYRVGMAELIRELLRV